MCYYQRLKDLREDKDLLQKDIADVINTSSNYYGDYEKGKRDIPTSRMIELAKFYNVSMDYITGLTNDKGGLHKNTDQEKLILEYYNSLNDFRKGQVFHLLKELMKEQEEEIAKSKETA